MKVRARMGGTAGSVEWRVLCRGVCRLSVLVVGWALAGCGGGNSADIAQILGAENTPAPTVGSGALGSVTGASQTSFQAASKIEFEMFDEQGRCQVNATSEVIALVGDYRGRAVAPGTPVAFFIASGRGIVEAEVATDETGLAKATVRSLCPDNARDPIVILAAVRGAEPFVDLNSNGRRDAGEPFQDLNREAFLDANQDDAYQPERGEYLIWDPNDNGRFDAGGNGVYDTDSIIVDAAVLFPVSKGRTAAPTPSGTPFTQTPTPPASAVPAFLQVALFSNHASSNNDGTLSTVITAQVSNSNGVALDNISVAFRIVPPVHPGVSVTSPSLTGDDPVCSLDFAVPGQPGSALSCVKYDEIYQGEIMSIEARVETSAGPLVSTQTFTLPDVRPIPAPTKTMTVSPTPKPVPKFLRVALFSNLLSANNDGTFSTPLTAVVGDKDGVALDDILVNFRILDAVSGVVITSPGVTGGPLPCVIRLPAPLQPPPPQPGDALTCIKYDSGLQGKTVIVEASIDLADGKLVDTTPVRLPSVGTTSADAAVSLHLALYNSRNATVDNGDGTFSSVLAALVGDENGVALDGLNVEFRQLAPVNPGVVITSPGVTGPDSGGTFHPCDAALLIVAQHGEALTCIKYDGAIGGQPISVEGRIRRSNGDLVTSETLVLPDFRIPTLSPTPSISPTGPFLSPTPTPTPTATFQANSIHFVGANPPAIGVRQSGRPEQSTLTFRVTDASSNPIPNVQVTFTLTAIGGERLSTLQAVTNSAGDVATVLTSGTRAAPVYVSAGADVNGDGLPDVFTQSTAVAVLGARPAQTRLSVASERLNVAGRRILGIHDRISVYVNDRFGNAVPPGTTVSFISNGASVVNPTVTDDFGVATATLVTEGGIPPTGIVTVLAFTRGEEGFQDTNGDGVFQAGQDVIVNDNRPEPFIDFRPLPVDLADGGLDDEMCPVFAPSAVCRDAFAARTQYDLFADTDANGLWNPQGTQGVWDTNILISDTVPVTFSGSLVAPDVTVDPPGQGDPNSFHLAKGQAVTVTFTLHDDLRNPLVGGSRVSVTTTKGKIAGGEITIPDGESFNQIVPGLNEFTVVVSNDASTTGMETPVSGGPASVVATITSDNGNATLILTTGYME